jgi:hypothetical protein
MARDNEKRRREQARKRQLFGRLLLQAQILYDSHKESEQTVMLNRMMLIILDVIGQRGLNSAKRQALADHFTDCALSQEGSVVELGGEGDRDTISISGNYDIADLAKRITWSEVRTGETLDESHTT